MSVLEDKIAIVEEAMSHEKNRRDGRQLFVDARESQEVATRLLAHATTARGGDYATSLTRVLGSQS